MGEKWRLKLKNIDRKNVHVMVPKIILYIAENKLIMNASPFFYE